MAILEIMKHGLQTVLLASALAALPVLADELDAAPLAKLRARTGLPAGDAAPDPLQLASSPTWQRQLPLYRAVMAQPLKAPYRLGLLADAYAQAAKSPDELLGLTSAVAGLGVARSSLQVLQSTETELRAAPDPLVRSLAWMAPMAPAGSAWSPALPDEVQLPRPLRFELAMLLFTLGRSQQFLQRSLAQLPAAMTPALLRRQALDGELLPFEEPDYRKLLVLVDREALLAGMQDLTAAVQRLRNFVVGNPGLPVLAWTLDTPAGQIVVDTTGRNNKHQLKDPLLVLDVGGDDEYEFLAPSESHRISVLLDHQGNDNYVARTPGADPSAATLGYGILWDTEGNDSYHGTQHAQASALFGAALLVDGGGHNQFSASSHAQAHALGGVAVLLSGTGNDQYTAQTHAQGSAGPDGVAVLLDPGGNEHYTLDNNPLLRPSPQLPSRNTSMGQGAGRGISADSADGFSTAGGIGILLDLAGDDHYLAQLFAQGSGYQEGLGLLVDDAGNDRLEAAWYAMGSGAHRGAGVLLKRGDGNDQYRASHSMSLGAAHDFSVGVFLDQGGNDQYRLGDLGLGAAHDNSVALFVDAKGDDNYQVDATACRALGTARISEWGGLREDLLNLGLFMDLGGTDSYPAHCRQARNNADWASARDWPLLKLRSEAGAGMDGDYASPFPVHALTSQPNPENAR